MGWYMGLDYLVYWGFLVLIADNLWYLFTYLFTNPYNGMGKGLCTNIANYQPQPHSWGHHAEVIAIGRLILGSNWPKHCHETKSSERLPNPSKKKNNGINGFERVCQKMEYTEYTSKMATWMKNHDSPANIGGSYFWTCPTHTIGVLPHNILSRVSCFGLMLDESPEKPQIKMLSGPL